MQKKRKKKKKSKKRNRFDCDIRLEYAKLKQSIVRERPFDQYKSAGLKCIESTGPCTVGYAATSLRIPVSLCPGIRYSSGFCYAGQHHMVTSYLAIQSRESAVGGDGDDGDDKEKEEEAERERLEAIREAEERRKEKHRKMEEEREKMRQEIRDKYNIKKREEVVDPVQEEPNPLMRKKKTPEELAREAEEADEDEFTSECLGRFRKYRKSCSIL
ncbi:unnamed protein product [Phyllotreta striolata]|uniref:Complexin n=1 Tax=Phyllotreta striolata TaxID=444603 RepID=A0A9N9TVX8_PHYSR|nr:unnamed protein product [Phyllotreta striolata]